MARKKKQDPVPDTFREDFAPSDEGPGAAIDLAEGRIKLPAEGAVAVLEVPAVDESYERVKHIHEPLPSPPEEPPPPAKWLVTLNCPTPLPYRTLEVEVPDEQAAKLAYYEANGICDSHHNWDIQRVTP